MVLKSRAKYESPQAQFLYYWKDILDVSGGEINPNDENFDIGKDTMAW